MQNKRSNTEEFIKRAREVHGDKYDYSKVEYVNNRTKVCIICPEHGEFWQRPYEHLRGKKCNKCAKIISSRKQAFTNEEFIERAKKVHCGKYDYSKTNYVDMKNKVCIICHKHGEFWQIPESHLSGRGCPSCNGTFKKTTEQFIEEARKVHGDKYDYSKVEYDGATKKVCIICPEHGEFWQTPIGHLVGRGCRKCANIRISKSRSDTFEKFLEKAIKIHGDKYEYDKSTYVDSLTKTRIICKQHGEFWQVPSSHLRGVGCPHCRESKLEIHIKKLLNEHKINYIAQYRSEWLKRFSLDFYLPEYNIGIECQGIQHFQPREALGGIAEHEKIINRDKIKAKLCEENNINLLYFSNKKYGINVIIKDDELIDKIVNRKRIC